MKPRKVRRHRQHLLARPQLLQRAEQVGLNLGRRHLGSGRSSSKKQAHKEIILLPLRPILPPFLRVRCANLRVLRVLPSPLSLPLQLPSSRRRFHQPQNVSNIPIEKGLTPFLTVRNCVTRYSPPPSGVSRLDTKFLRRMSRKNSLSPVLPWAPRAFTQGSPDVSP